MNQAPIKLTFRRHLTSIQESCNMLIEFKESDLIYSVCCHYPSNIMTKWIYQQQGQFVQQSSDDRGFLFNLSCSGRSGTSCVTVTNKQAESGAWSLPGFFSRIWSLDDINILFFLHIWISSYLKGLSKCCVSFYVSKTSLEDLVLKCQYFGPQNPSLAFVLSQKSSFYLHYSLLTGSFQNFNMQISMWSMYISDIFSDFLDMSTGLSCCVPQSTGLIYKTIFEAIQSSFTRAQLRGPK